eukprot:CAMPEP_0174844494 /NCGR_PEP_ID=MMETSP1114-20130205/11130_1 /TAXON_ID=312471 /ORGANISM="Neobodo designis, Strain CCAP 1951/1" /LENGTH=547 /DNA_ID=CAMNT_0016078731 /DNA_START=55 /DNA_END=1698 /DNA_ORIENTATION=+
MTSHHSGPPTLVQGATITSTATGIEYVVEQLLGSGTFGGAYLATVKKTGARVVVKVQSLAVYKFAIVEQQLLESLRNRNIVRYLDGWRTEGESFIVLEHCSGGDARTVIRRRNRARASFAEPTIRSWVVQMALALHYCHAQHILHRDFKAENILLEGDTIKLADFGLARSVEDTADFATTRVGTPQCLPPEVLEQWPYNARADMWSLGVLVYELITLQRPFTGRTTNEILDSVRYDTPPAAEELSRHVYSKELYDLCSALMSRDPTKRPTAADILEAPWASVYLPKGLTFDSRVQRERELEGWHNIVHTATLPEGRSRMFLHTNRNLSINVRREPDFGSEVIRRLNRGDAVEVVGVATHEETGTRYLKLLDGYCIQKDPSRANRDIMRELPEWRIRRPGQPEPKLPSETSSTRSTVCPDSEKQVQHLLAAPFESSQKRVEAMLTFCAAQGLDENVIRDLIADYDRLAVPNVEDTAWTFHCITTLRPYQCVHCVRVIRLVIHEMLRRDASANGRASGDGDGNSVAEASPKSHRTQEPQAAAAGRTTAA